MLKYLLLWFPMLLIAILNGTLREALYKKHTGELAAHQISTVTLILFFAVYIYGVLQRFPPATATQAMLVGLLWLVLTLAFEFGFGRFRGRSWGQLLADYNLLEGRVWVFIPLWVAVAPFLFYSLKK